MPESLAISINHLTHRYGQRVAIDDLSLQINTGELFGMLGPNGSGKTTLFRILSTLIPPSEPTSVQIFGSDLTRDPQAIRRRIGVVFQSPSLDKQLTAFENLRHHGHLYGLRGHALNLKVKRVLESANLLDRASERVGTFSGGMRRRVELAKGLLTDPQLLLLDEPSTGLDPAARIDLWNTIERVRGELGVTVVLTTHLMDEADRCDRLAVIDRGRMLACDTPAALKAKYVGGDVVTMTGEDLPAIRSSLRDKLSIESSIVGTSLRFQQAAAAGSIPRIVAAISPDALDSISVGRPTLEDVFVRLTGDVFATRQNEESNLKNN